MLLKKLPLLVFTFYLASCSPKLEDSGDNWCNQKIRSELSELAEIQTSSNWFKVYNVGEGVFAIAEPYNFQEIISYLILGTEKALLFDTGMGLSSIASVADELTKLPITVLNSHTHYDHIGGNHEFDNILTMNTEYTKLRAQNGIAHDRMKHEVAPNAICLERLPDLDTASYHAKPFTITGFVQHGSEIELGNRKLRVVTVPGHTPDAIALLDESNGYLWTGDTFYEGPIWLFDAETDLDEYQVSAMVLAGLSAIINKVFPAHNTPIAEPERLVEMAKGFKQILDKTKLPDRNESDQVTYEFEHLSFVIRADRLKEKGLVD